MNRGNSDYLFRRIAGSKKISSFEIQKEDIRIETDLVSVDG